MTLLTPTPISTSRFTWSPSDRMFVTEESSLGPDFRPGPVFDDACDIGITLVSHRTGKQIVCALVGEERDREGELVATVYAPVTPTGARDREHPFTVHVLND